MPGSLKVSDLSLPSSSVPVSKLPSSAVAVWGAESCSARSPCRRSRPGPARGRRRSRRSRLSASVRACRRRRRFGGRGFVGRVGRRRTAASVSVLVVSPPPPQEASANAIRTRAGTRTSFSSSGRATQSGGSQPGPGHRAFPRRRWGRSPDVKLIFAPIGIVAGLLAGLVAKKGFEQIWSVFDEEEPAGARPGGRLLPEADRRAARRGSGLPGDQRRRRPRRPPRLRAERPAAGRARTPRPARHSDYSERAFDHQLFSTPGPGVHGGERKTDERNEMSILDKLTGRAKQAAGDLTDDAGLAPRGQTRGEEGREEGRAGTTPRRRPIARPTRSPTSSARPELAVPGARLRARPILALSGVVFYSPLRLLLRRRSRGLPSLDRDRRLARRSGSPSSTRSRSPSRPGGSAGGSASVSPSAASGSTWSAPRSTRSTHFAVVADDPGRASCSPWSPAVAALGNRVLRARALGRGARGDPHGADAALDARPTPASTSPPPSSPPSSASPATSTCSPTVPTARPSPSSATSSATGPRRRAWRPSSAPGSRPSPPTTATRPRS